VGVLTLTPNASSRIGAMANPFDPNKVILTGENPFIRLSESEDGPVTTNANFWRILLCPQGPGHVLFLRSELTDGLWRIYSDNIAMTRWLQATVQGVLNEELRDAEIPVIDADFDHVGDVRSFWTERVRSDDDDISLTWYEIGEPVIRHTQPFSQPERPYGSSSVLIPCMGARLTVNSEQAVGVPFPRTWDDRPFSTCALAFAESWTEWP
jgi:hypothetical protein